MLGNAGAAAASPFRSSHGHLTMYAQCHTLALGPSHADAESQKWRSTKVAKRLRERHENRKDGNQRGHPDLAPPLSLTARQGCNESHASCQVPRKSSYFGKYPGTLLLEKYSGRNHAPGTWAAGVWATTATDPGKQTECAGTSPRRKSTRGSPMREWYSGAGNTRS